MNKTISRWEKFKRIVAHAFDLQTKQEIRDHFEHLAWKEEQAELMKAHERHLKHLQYEYREQIAAWEEERHLRQIQEEAERRRQESIAMYKDNRMKQMRIFDGYEEVAVGKDNNQEEDN